MSSEMYNFQGTNQYADFLRDSVVVSAVSDKALLSSILVQVEPDFTDKEECEVALQLINKWIIPGVWKAEGRKYNRTNPQAVLTTLGELMISKYCYVDCAYEKQLRSHYDVLNNKYKYGVLAFHLASYYRDALENYHPSTGDRHTSWGINMVLAEIRCYLSCLLIANSVDNIDTLPESCLKSISHLCTLIKENFLWLDKYTIAFNRMSRLTKNILESVNI